MANPLKMLKLKSQGVQFIQELPVKAPPKKVWSTLIDSGSWFQFDLSSANQSKQAMDLRPGGLWTAHNADGSAVLFGTIVYYEPGKLLRINGQLGMTHMPINAVIIFELQPQKDGKTTLLRVGTRMLGYMDADVKKRVTGGWKHLLGQLKAVAEK